MIIVKNQMEKRKWKGLKEVCVGMLFVIVFFTTTYLTGVGVQAGADVLYDKTGDEVDISNGCTSVEEIEYMEEPIVKAEIMVTSDYIGAIMDLCQERRGIYDEMEYIEETRAVLRYHLPLNEIIYDFFACFRFIIITC